MEQTSHQIKSCELFQNAELEAKGQAVETKMAEKEIKSASPKFELFPEKWDTESIIGGLRYEKYVKLIHFYQNMSSSTTGSSLSCSFSQFHFSMISTSTPGLWYEENTKMG